jgi:hypothetical protein
MVAFKKVWDDVCGIITNKKLENVEIVEGFDSGFVLKVEENIHFITKQDFVDFWCGMVCENKIDKERVMNHGNSDKKIVYDILKQLPYINEKEETLKMSQNLC